MDEDLKELFQVNDDIIFILHTGSKIGWKEIKPQSMNRIVYLSKVLFAFVNDKDPNIMNYYHFNSNISGPISSIINRSLIDLESKEFITSQNSGLILNISEKQLTIIQESFSDENKQFRQEWFKIILFLLGKFGENKIFSFAINDPLYLENVQSNSSKEISFENDENKTLSVLNSFKDVFEQSIEDTTSINKREYLELYFDYIFSQIIK